MKYTLKMIIIFILAYLLQACHTVLLTPIYVPTGKTADLSIDIDPEYEPSMTVLVDGGNGNFFDPDQSLLYGSRDFKNQYNKVVKIASDRKLSLIVYYNIDLNEYCYLKASFTPAANKFYRLTVDVDYDKNGFIYTLIHGNQDMCYVAISEIVDGKLIPVK